MISIKICGISTLDDARAAVGAGADLLGFNFYPQSVRFIDVQTCALITSILRQESPSVQLVGVFVNSSLNEINRTMELCSLDMAQLSGDETPQFRAALGGKAFKALHGASDAKTLPYVRSGAPAFLLDSSVRGLYGGTGVAADWSSAAELAKAYPLLLAGGLKPENVAQAVRQVKPWGVDVASGVETAPGRKDAAKMRAFVDAVRSLERETT